MSEESLRNDKIVFFGKAITLFSIFIGLPAFFHVAFLNEWQGIVSVFPLTVWFGLLCYVVGIWVEKGWWF